MLNVNKTIKSVIFDMGGVILDFTQKKSLEIPWALSIMFKIPQTKAMIIWTKNKSDLITGKETPLEFLKKMTNQLNSTKNPKKLLMLWEKLSLKESYCIDWELLDFIKRLKNKYEIYVLSDAIDLAQNDKITNKIKSVFNDYFVSYKEGFRKPDKDAFKNVLNKISRNPEECVFVDDMEQNIVAANKIGIQSIKFTHLKDLIYNLRKVGITTG